MESVFKKEQPLEKRKEESARIREKYPNRIPVIVEKSYSSHLQTIDKKKYLVPGDLTLGQLVYVIRKRIPKMTAEKGLFVFINDSLIPMSETLAKINKDHADEDGFLYLVYSEENTFG